MLCLYVQIILKYADFIRQFILLAISPEQKYFGHNPQLQKGCKYFLYKWQLPNQINGHTLQQKVKQ